MAARLNWPDGKRFAFSVFDDTDLATVENVGPVYALLADLGMRTTKSVWPIAGAGEPTLGGGATCDDPDYRQWVLGLQQQGFEIGLHHVTYHACPREETIRGLKVFRETFGHDPKTFANHANGRPDDSIYWYDRRVSGSRAFWYRLLTRFKSVGWSRGHVEGDPWFWGDLCQGRIQYVRNFIFGEINTLRACPWMPYHDPLRPYVNSWFASAPGGDCNAFVKTIGERNQDRLEEEGGACIMYTHFAKGFADSGRLDGRFRHLMERLARKGGFFVPVGDLLDYILQERGPVVLTNRQRAGLERRWLLRKVLFGNE